MSIDILFFIGMELIGRMFAWYVKGLNSNDQQKKY